VKRVGIVALGICAMGLSACITAPDQAPPAWSTERANQPGARGYPSLQDVPHTTIANTDAQYWERHRREMVAAGQAVKGSPRAQWTPVEDPNAFIEDARAQLEATRLSHEPE
jgi:hypothetical protein